MSHHQSCKSTQTGVAFAITLTANEKLKPRQVKQHSTKTYLYAYIYICSKGSTL